MKKLYQKSELAFSLVWIAAYVVLLSVADALSDQIGFAKLVTAPLCVALAVVATIFIRRNGLSETYGLCRFEGRPGRYLYFIPLVLLASTNVWWGVTLNYRVEESVLYVVSMLGVGFLEEIIFRGFLFKAMAKDNVPRAVVVSSLTFGIGHIVNLLNGANVPETLLQIGYAVAAGFLFTVLFYKGKSLWPCIVTHGVLNSLSAFTNEANRPVWGNAVSAVFLCVVSLGYALYIVKQKREGERKPPKPRGFGGLFA